MTDDPSNHSPSGPAVPPTVSRTQDAPTGAADVTPASVTSPVSTGPPERPPVHPQHPSSGTWRAVRTAGAPLSVREGEAAGPRGAPPPPPPPAPPFFGSQKKGGKESSPLANVPGAFSRDALRPPYATARPQA